MRCSSRWCFEQLALGLQLLEPLGQLEPDRLGRLLHRRPGRDVVRIGVDPHLFEARALLAGQRIELDDLLDLVAEEADPPGHVLVVRREDLQIVAAHAEIAALEGGVVALVLQRDELADDLALVVARALLQVEDHRRIGFDRADAVEAADRGDDDHVVAFEQRAGGRMPHPVDRLVHRAFLLDVGVGARNIGLGLVVVVVGDEILDRVVGKEALEFAIELRGEDLVGGEDQRGALQLLDHLGHGEGLAAAGDAEQHLGRLAAAMPSTSSAIAVGWSPAGWYSETDAERAAASAFSGRCGLVRHEAAEVSGSSRPRRMTSSAMGGLWG